MQKRERTAAQKTARIIGLILVIGGGVFAALSFGAGLGAFVLVTLLFVIPIGIVLLYVGRKRRNEEERAAGR